MKKFTLFFVICFLWILFDSSFTQADTKTWLPTAGGAWTTASNWSTGFIPTTGDDIIINSSQSDAITAVPAITLNSLTVSGNCNLVGSGNPSLITVTGTFSVSASVILTLGNGVNGNRVNITIFSTCLGTIDGTVTMNTGPTNEVFTNSGDLTISPSGLITEATNAATFTLSAGATLRIGSTDGITTSGATGNVQVTSRTYNTGASYVYSGTAAQVTGNGLMQHNPVNLTINNSAGVSLTATTTISGLLTMTSGTLDMAGFNLTVGSLTGSGNITNSSGTAGARTITIGSDNTSPAEYNGIISTGTATSVAVTKSGTGTLILSGLNTYDGVTTIKAGKISINTIQNVSGGSSSLGAPTTVANGTIAIGATGILNYTGSGHSSDRVIKATDDGATIDASGSGTLTLTGGKTGNFNLILTGTGEGIESGVIAGGAHTLTKEGAGSWTLSGACTYTGLTTVSAGILQYGISDALNGDLTINSGAELVTNSYALTFNGNFINNGTFTAGSSPFDIAGAVTQSIDGFSTTCAIIVSKTAGTATLNNATSAASLTFTASGATLSVSSSLTLTGAVTLNNAATANVTAAVTGAGSLSCGSIAVGNNTVPTGNNSNFTHTLNSTITNFTVSGNLNINSYFATNNRIRNGFFILESGIVTVNGSATTVNANAVNTSLITMATGAQTGTLVLGGATPFTISGTGTSTTTLNGTGATVNYSYAGAQIVYAATYTNLTLSGSGAKTTTGATVNGTLSMQGTATTTGTVATYTSGAALEYKGSGAQTTGTEFPATWSGTGGVIINNASGVTLVGFKTISNLTLTNGTLTLGASSITIDPAGIISGGSASSYVKTDGVGQLKRTVNNNDTYVLFPVGLSAYNPLNIKLDTASVTDVFGVKVSDAIANSGYDPTKAVNRQWDITKATSDPSNATIQFQFNAGEGLTDYGTGQIGHWNGSSYDEIASGISGSGPYIITNIQLITSFSPFIVGNAVPMPVELSSFTANVISRDVKLNWITATETNNAGFEIQKSTQNNNWTKVGYITGNGTKTTSTNYTFEEKKLNTGKYNYRLKQIDYNGNFEYFNLKGQIEIGVPNKFDISQNYPNPFNPTTKIDFDLPYDSKVSMKLFDISGREVMTLINETKAAGYYTVLMNGNNLSSGMYFYRIIAEGNGQNFVSTKKLVLIK